MPVIRPASTKASETLFTVPAGVFAHHSQKLTAMPTHKVSVSSLRTARPRAGGRRTRPYGPTVVLREWAAGGGTGPTTGAGRGACNWSVVPSTGRPAGAPRCCMASLLPSRFGRNTALRPDLGILIGNLSLA